MFRLHAAGEGSEFPTALMTLEPFGTSSIRNCISDALETQSGHRNDKKISKSSVKALANILHLISNIITTLVFNFNFIFSDK